MAEDLLQLALVRVRVRAGVGARVGVGVRVRDMLRVRLSLRLRVRVRVRAKVTVKVRVRVRVTFCTVWWPVAMCCGWGRGSLRPSVNHELRRRSFMRSRCCGFLASSPRASSSSSGVAA